MNHLVDAAIVFACVFGSALLGSYLRRVLPQNHLSDESTGVVKLATGLVATMAALVLGLLISSAKGSFDTMNMELLHSAAAIVRLDRVLARYGPETGEIRSALKRTTEASVAAMSSGDSAQLAGAAPKPLPAEKHSSVKWRNSRRTPTRSVNCRHGRCKSSTMYWLRVGSRFFSKRVRFRSRCWWFWCHGWRFSLARLACLRLATARR